MGSVKHFAIKRKLLTPLPGGDEVMLATISLDLTEFRKKIINEFRNLQTLGYLNACLQAVFVMKTLIF